jgi:hypothetical protein
MLDFPLGDVSAWCPGGRAKSNLQPLSPEAVTGGYFAAQVPHACPCWAPAEQAGVRINLQTPSAATNAFSQPIMKKAGYWRATKPPRPEHSLVGLRHCAEAWCLSPACVLCHCSASPLKLAAVEGTFSSGAAALITSNMLCSEFMKPEESRGTAASAEGHRGRGSRESRLCFLSVCTTCTILTCSAWFLVCWRRR